MAKVTNTGKTPRGINIRGTDDAHGQIVINPGETHDVEVFDPGNRVYHGWQSTGEMDFGGTLINPSQAAAYHAAKGDGQSTVSDRAERERAEQVRREEDVKRTDEANEARVQAEVNRRLAEAAQAQVADLRTKLDETQSMLQATQGERDALKAQASVSQGDGSTPPDSSKSKK